MTINTKAVYDKYVEQGGKLSYVAFKETVFAYNKAMIQECITTGNEWYLKGKMGILKIARCRRKVTVLEDDTIRGAIDWGESNKLKKKIISEGRLPLEVYKDEEGNKTGDNGGIAWLCYFTSDFFYRWSHSPDLYLKNSFKFKLDMSWTNSKLLSQAIDEKSPFLYKFIEDKPR